MARYAVIQAGLVANVIEADQAWVDAHAPGAVLLDEASPAGPGWRYSNGTFAAPLPPAPTVPAEVTRRQAIRALLDAGITEAMVLAAINALPEPQRSHALIDWQESNSFERRWPMLNGLASALNLSQAQLDLLFIAAARL
jgi:hypothetical protein